MRANGYQTACIGKWHLGRDWPITQEQRSHRAIARIGDSTAKANRTEHSPRVEVLIVFIASRDAALAKLR
jgi:arylsulfatase A-like enzyme